MKRRLFLHVGTGKTGTSTIQSFFGSNRAVLKEKGYYYPSSPGKQRHKLLSWAAKPEANYRRADSFWILFHFGSHDELRIWLRRALQKEIEAADCPNVVMSDEGLFSLLGPKFIDLDWLFGDLFDQIVILVYLRRQDDHLLSRYKQTLGKGRIHTLEEVIARRQPHNLDYYNRLRSMSEAFPHFDICARVYSKSRFVDNPLIVDVLNSIEIDDVDGFKIPKDRNQSLDAICAEYMRRHNLSHGRMKDRLQKKLLRFANGQDFYFARKDRARLMARLEASNRNLVKQFLPGAEDVFLAPAREKEGIHQSEITDSDLRVIEKKMKRRVTL